MSAAVVLSSCGSYNAATGAMAGGQFGHVIGSAVGGITGGWRGSEWGSLIGTVGGMAAGAAIGSSIDKKQHEAVMGKKAKRQTEKVQRQQTQRQQQQTRQYDDSGFDPQGRGDDRIVFDQGASLPQLQIRNAGIYESVKDGVLTRGEECQVVFEIFNNTSEAVYDVRPLVEDVTGNKHINISPNLIIENIAPHKGVRYTATVLADSRLKDGEILVRIGVAQGENEITSETREFTVPTAKAAR